MLHALSAKQKLFLRKLFGVSCILFAVGIFVYLGWFYFVMPQLIVDQRDTLAQAFDADSFAAVFTRHQTQVVNTNQGKVMGGIWYPHSHNTPIPPIAPAAPIMQPEGPVYLSVPELNIKDAVVQLDVDGTNATIYHTVLTKAVAHFAHTAYPGEKGNVFFFGHSKLPLLAGSDYESIFTNLPRIKSGAIIEVTAADKKFRYRVNYTAVLSPKDVFILNQPKEERLLTLMTCIPPGFGSERYVAVANLIGMDNV
jgi:LPXTG-site transpeptidase (sortase) family protein